MIEIKKNIISLKIVAWLFLIGGFFSIIKAIFSAYNGHLSVDMLGVLLFFVGRGLLKQRKPWRIWALVMIWVYMIWITSFIVYVIYSSNLTNLYYYILDQKNYSLLGSSALFALIVILLVFFWEYIVLIRKDVKALLK